jgi:hypothetical protein
MLAAHKSFGRPVIFAGGSWNWCGHFPENYYTELTTKVSIDACRKNGVDAAMMTLWFDDGCDAHVFSNLYALSYMAELCYYENPDEALLDSRFAATTGSTRKYFRELTAFHNKLGGAEDYPIYSNRFLGKPLFWQDVLEGLFDSHLIGNDMSAHYAYYAEQYKNAPKDKYAYIYEYAVQIFTYMAAKCRVGEKLHPAYQAKDTAVLREILEVDLPALLKEARAMHKAHKELWYKTNKAIGFSVLDRRYAGNTTRIETAIERLGEYLDGKLPSLPELEDRRLFKGIAGFIKYHHILQQP